MLNLEFKYKLILFIVFILLIPGRNVVDAKSGLNQYLFLRDIVAPMGLVHSVAPSQEIYNGYSVGQAFKCNCDNLNQVGIYFLFKKEAYLQELIFHLKEYPGGKTIATVPFKPSLAGETSSDKTYQKIKFDAIHNSKSKKYLWIIEAPNIQKPAGIQILGSKEKPDHFQILDRFKNDRVNGGILFFYTFCSYSFHLDKIVSEIWSRLWREKGFIGLYLIGLFWLGRNIFFFRKK